MIDGDGKGTERNEKKLKRILKNCAKELSGPLSTFFTACLRGKKMALTMEGDSNRSGPQEELPVCTLQLQVNLPAFGSRKVVGTVGGWSHLSTCE